MHWKDASPTPLKARQSTRNQYERGWSPSHMALPLSMSVSTQRDMPMPRRRKGG